MTTRRYRQAQPNQLGIRISCNIRRPRHECDASTAQASLEWHEHRINKTSPTGGHSGPPLRREFGICSASDIRDNHGHHVRADTAVRPYAEFVSDCRIYRRGCSDYPPVFRTTWLSGYCYRLWPKACLFIIVRAFVAQIGMPSVAIVPSLDPSKDVLYC